MNQLIDPKIPHRKQTDSVNPPRADHPWLAQPTTDAGRRTDEPARPKHESRRWIRTFLIIGAAAILLGLGVLFTRAYALGSKVFVSNTSFFTKLENLIFGGTSPGSNGSTGTVTVLLMGYGGAGHDGPYLTDSMMLAKIDLGAKKVYLTSIPRDLYYESPYGEKINAVFAEGFGGTHKLDYAYGGDQAKAAIAQLSGEKVDYFAAMDFEGFTEAVDSVGGIDVNVPDTFTDYTYPNDATNGYLPPVTFKAGEQHMDGARALIFSRSRHSPDSNEGSDFARSRRQQIVLSAFKGKVLQMNVLANPSKVNELIGILADHFHTDMDPAEVLAIAKALNSPDTQVVSESLDQDSGYVCPVVLPTDGAYVLKTCDGVTDQQVQQYIQNGFEFAGVRAEHASVVIENAGTNSTLFSQVEAALKAAGVTVYETVYRGGIELPQSQLYEVNSAAPKTEAFIEGKLNIQHQPKPAQMTAKTDLVLLVGDQ